MRAEEGTQMSLLALLSRTSSLGPGSAIEGNGHLPLQIFNETEGISVTLRKGAYMERFVVFFPSYLPFLFLSSWIINHFHLESPGPTASFVGGIL